jgi:hypothetical protein
MEGMELSGYRRRGLDFERRWEVIPLRVYFYYGKGLR